MKTLKAVWLAVGFFQVALIAGCNAQNDAQASQDHRDSAGTETGAPSKAVNINKVRISRAFFERSIIGDVKLDHQEIQSNVAWQVGEPIGAAPQEPVIADFRERIGCAIYEDTQGVKLCFKVIPDISSLGVNADEVHAEGLCNGNFKNMRFVSATKSEGQLTVTFAGTCAGEARTAEFKLRQI